ncbi:MAG: YggT family protein [Ruminococcaceae bacterium]|nr:YggT family protein [Oscillospiraceae bacterium]
MIIDFLRTFILAILRAYELLFIVRAILSWFPMMELGGIMSFIYSVTEPVLAPIRSMLHRVPFLRDFPLDFSIIVAYILIDVIRVLFLQI